MIRRYRIDIKYPGKTWEVWWDQFASNPRQAVDMQKSSNRIAGRTFPEGTRFRAERDDSVTFFGDTRK